MANIYTKKGDGGFAQGPKGILIKSDIVIELLGSIDETQASIGILYEMLLVEFIEIKVQLEIIMDYLYKSLSGIYLQSDLADDSIVLNLEKWMDEMDKTLEPLTKFILPIGSKASAFAHLARSITRKAERLFIRWIDANAEEFKKNKLEYKYINIRKFLNRLSDYLFIVARVCINND